MSELSRTLAHYIPAPVVRRIAANPVPLSAPVGERFNAAVLFAEIFGFTSVAEQFIQRDPPGVEELSRTLNEYSKRLIDLVEALGGEVINYAGGALLALWPVYEPIPSLEAALHDMVLQASRCGLTIQKILSDYLILEGITHPLRIGIGAGEVITAHIGGVFGRWEYVVGGSPLAQTSIAKERALLGEVILSPQAWQMVHTKCQGDVIEDKYVQLESVSIAPDRKPPPPPRLTENAQAALRAYIPGAILHNLAAGQADWLGELRRLTVLFFRLPGLGSEDIPLELAQTIMSRLQKTLYRYEGSINKLSVFDSGMILVAAMGLPPFAHEDDPMRGLLVAFAMKNELDNLDIPGIIGVASGDVFCGSVGSDTRREYVLIGEAVTTAARLVQDTSILAMATASSSTRIPIFCDETTYLTTLSQVDFDAPSHLRVKARAPITIYSPVGLKKAFLPHKTGLVGRLKEQEFLGEALQALIRTRNTQVILMEAGAGMGKSRMVEYLMQQAELMNLVVLYGAADAIKQTTCYYAWRYVFAQLLDIDTSAPMDRQRHQVLDVLKREPDLLPLSPLLNSILPLDLPDNNLTGQMTGQVRADNTRKLLYKLLHDSVRDSPKVLIIEDAHWLDSASWAFLYQVSQEVKSLLIVVTIQQFIKSPLEPDLIPKEYIQITRSPHTRVLNLDMLNPAETLELVCQRLKVVSLPSPVGDLILLKAGGHPLFSEEIGYALRDAGLIQTVNGECRVTPGVGDLRELDFPSTIQEVITSRINRLTATQQLALKVASVIGQVVAFDVLLDVFPIPDFQDQLSKDMETLQVLDITPLKSRAPDLTYMFKHAISQEVAYNLMPYAQRSTLHQAVAEWYERNYKDRLSNYYSVLAYHWTHALGSWEERINGRKLDQALLINAIDNLEKASDKALREGSYKECTDFLTQALKLEPRRSTPSPPLRRASWLRQLAEAYYGLNDLTKTEQHLNATLDLLGIPRPKNNRGRLVRIAANILRRGWQYAFNRNLPPLAVRDLESPEDHIRIEAACIYDRLSAIYYLTKDTYKLVDAILEVIRLAEPFGPSPELVRGYAAASVAAGTIPLHGIAEIYSRWTDETAQTLEQPSALAQALLFSNTYHVGAGQWAKALPENQQAAEIFEQIGDNSHWGETLSALGLIAYFQGEFEESRQLFTRLCEIAVHSDNLLQQSWGLAGMAAAQVRLGRFDNAIDLSSRALQLLKHTSDPNEEIRAYAAIGWASLRQQQWTAVLQTIGELDRLIEGTPPRVYSTFEGYALRAQAYLELWEISTSLDHPQAREIPRPSPGQPSWRVLSQRALKGLKGFARVFPIGTPRAILCQGSFEWLSGRHERALRTLGKSLEAAHQFKMPYEGALGCYELGRHSYGEARQENLHQAAAIFEQLGAVYEGRMARNHME